MNTPEHDDDAKPLPEQGELFERHLAATYPSENSQAGIALAALIKAVRLRQSNWMHVGWRLAAAIHELINLGWPVVSMPVREDDRKRPVAEYSMPQWVLTALWNEGRGMNRAVLKLLRVLELVPPDLAALAALAALVCAVAWGLAW